MGDTDLAAACGDRAWVADRAAEVGAVREVDGPAAARERLMAAAAAAPDEASAGDLAVHLAASHGCWFPTA